MAKFILPEDVDVKTALDMLEIFKTSVNELVILHNVIMSDGKVLVKGGAVHDLLVEIINCQKQLRMDKAFDDTKGILHTHIWSNVMPHKLYSHSHSRGDIPHSHHGSRYWRVEK